MAKSTILSIFLVFLKREEFGNNKNLKFVNVSGTALCLGPTSLHEGVFS